MLLHSMVKVLIMTKNTATDALSYLCYMQKKKDNKLLFYKQNKIKENATFEEFAKQVCLIPDHKSDRHFRSQFSHIIWFDGSLISDFIIRFSHIQEDLDRLSALIKLPEIVFPHRNKSQDEAYTNHYTPELIELVAERYKVDIELFGFEFGKNLDSPINFKDLKHLTVDNQLIIARYKSMRSEYYIEFMMDKTWPKSKSIRRRLQYLFNS